ncbi:Na+/H+ antiporter NhaC [Bacillus sp. JZ8]
MKKKLSFIEALGIIVLILALIFVCLFIFKVPPHIPILGSVILLGFFGFIKGIKWKELEKGIIEGISLGIKPILILSLVGVLISVWMMSGTIPTILYFGFDFLSPHYFLVSSLFITILISTFTGSTFTTVSTVGVALMGISSVMGVDPALAAGAIISGAAFGDKMSPLSDTTNFAAGIVEVDMFTHIRHMMWTTVPSLLLSSVLFLVLGLQRNAAENLDYEQIAAVKEVLSNEFTLSLLTLISPLIVLFLSIRRKDVVPTLIIGILTAFITTVLVQPQFAIGEVLLALQDGVSIDSGNKIVDGIVNRGGLQSMMSSVSLVMIALSLGGLMKTVGVITAFLEGIISLIKRSGDVIFSTALASIGVNLITGEQYLSVLLPGQTFKPLYNKYGLENKNLARTLEDAGTLVNPLIPWGVSGAFISQVLGVSVQTYVPWSFFLLFCPLFSIIFAYTGIGVAKKSS